MMEVSTQATEALEDAAEALDEAAEKLEDEGAGETSADHPDVAIAEIQAEVQKDLAEIDADRAVEIAEIHAETETARIEGETKKWAEEKVELIDRLSRLETMITDLSQKVTTPATAPLSSILPPEGVLETLPESQILKPEEAALESAGAGDPPAEVTVVRKKRGRWV